MDEKMLDRFIELHGFADTRMLTDEEWKEWAPLYDSVQTMTAIVTELLRLREAGSKKDAMIYELAKNIIYYADKVSGDDDPDWIKAIANCTHPDDPDVLAECVKAALSFMEADNVDS